MDVELGDMRVDIWPLAVVVLAIVLFSVWRKKHNLSHLLCSAVFGTYILIAVEQAFFPLAITGTFVDQMRQQPFLSQTNFIPFYFGPFGTLDTAFTTLLLNVLLTLPFGFGLNFVARVSGKSFLWIALLVGFGIEFLQLISSLILRYAYRTVDINDVIMNALGVLLGYGIFRLFSALYLAATQRFSIEHNGLSAYIYEVVMRIQSSDAPS